MNRISAEQIVERVDKLLGERKIWETHWQDCADYVLPRKNSITRIAQPGEKKGFDLFDSTAVQANELLAGALHGMLTNPTTFWFELSTGDEKLDDKDAIKKWLQATSTVMHTVLNNSNFQTEIHETYLDLTTFGTSGLSIEDDQEFHVRFGARHISEIVVEENNKGVIDTVYRTFKWTPKQIVQEFGDDALKLKEVREKYEANSSEKMEIIHVIMPRNQEGMAEELTKIPKGLPWASRYVLKHTKEDITESGFHEWPFPVSRWTKSSGEQFGRSPTMKVLADVKMVNKMMETTLKGAQKAIDPPLQLPDDGFIMPLKTTPGGINYYRSGSGDRIEPLFSDTRIDFGYQAVDDVRKRIKEGYYVDIFQLAQGPQMTATEVNQRTEEKMRLLGPVLGRLQSELLQPLISRVFFILLRKGVIDKKLVPAELSGKSLVVRYSSLVARAQRTSEGDNFTRAMQTVQPLIQLDPSVMDNLDTDQTFRFILDTYGSPHKLLKDVKDRDKIRDARAKAQQDAVQQQQEQHQAETLGKVAPAMKAMKDAQAPVGGQGA